ncbi:MAG: hypothetical protein ACRC6V_18450, partial [Bacteroidales bacterium]
MTVNIKTGFADQDYLYDIRQNLLNPLAVKVSTLEDKMNVVKPLAESAYTTVDVNLLDKEIHFHSQAGGGVVNLTGMFREGSDLAVSGDSGSAAAGVTAIKFVDGKLKETPGNPLEVSYDWSTIIPANQETLTVGTIMSGTKKTKHLFFRGADVIYTGDDIATVDIKAGGLTASIPGATPVPFPDQVPIRGIELVGKSSGSTIDDGILQIVLGEGGGTDPTVFNQNFKGFFETLGDIQSQVQDPISGKSYAFAKDSTLGGKYYTPYFYVNGNWTELKQDPAMTYNAPSASTNQGVFSIKPSDKITIDANGQLDLDGLTAAPDPKYFHGFFSSYNELSTSVTNPISEKSFAYVKHANGGWIGYRATMQGSASLWQVFAPISSFSLVDSKTSTTVPATVYGIYKNEDWELDTNGLLTLKEKESGLTAEIIGEESEPVVGKFKTIQFLSGKSYANLDKDKEKLFLSHPQRVIQYDSGFEADHNTQDYKGNIFYDETSNTWKGWATPKAPGAVGKKWTSIAHEGMSDEVKDLVKRIPAKAPSVTPGIVGDNRAWDYNGVTYLEQGDASLPEEIKGVCGAYITTSVANKDAPEITIPQTRIQTCIADRESGGSWVRRFISTGSPGSATSWSQWVRTSFSTADIDKHAKDPNCHKSIIKYHKVTSFTARFANFIQQSGPEGVAVQGGGTVLADNCDLITDNYGFTSGMDYLEFPYEDDFNIRGEIALSGYKTTKYPACTWEIALVLKRNGQSSYQPFEKFTYSHTDTTKKYPPMSFFLSRAALKMGDQLLVKIKCSNHIEVLKEHPELYFVPVKSYLMIEDKACLAGYKIAKTFRKHMANLNSSGDLEAKMHRNDYTTTGAIRLYVDAIIKTPVEMTKS